MNNLNGKCVPSNRNAHSNLGSEYVNNLNGRRRIVHLVTEVAGRLVETLRLVTLKWYRDAHLREESIHWFTQPNSGCVNLRRDIFRKWDRNEACLVRSYWSTLLIYMIDMYYTPPNMKEAGIRIGEKSLRMDGTDTEREPKLIFWFVNCRLVRSQTLEKVLIVALNLRDETCHTLKNVLQFGVPIYIIHLAMTMNGPDRSKNSHNMITICWF